VHVRFSSFARQAHAILKNPEAIAIHQDPLAAQARRVAVYAPLNYTLGATPWGIIGVIRQRGAPAVGAGATKTASSTQTWCYRALGPVALQHDGYAALDSHVGAQFGSKGRPRPQTQGAYSTRLMLPRVASGASRRRERRSGGLVGWRAL
jgi:hypothetical protein